MPTIYTFAGQNVFIDFTFIFFAKYLSYLCFIIFLVAIFSKKDRFAFLRNVFFTALSLILSFGVIEGTISFLFPSNRPFVTYGFEPLISPPPTASFPSSHATILFTLVGALFLLKKQRVAIWLTVLSTIIVLSRIYAGLHYPIDVLAGAVIGLGSALLVSLIVPKIKVRREE